MPGILVPGVAEFKIHGAVGAGVWDVILHYFGSPPGGAYTQAQLQSMVTGFSNVTWTSFLSSWPTTTTLLNITATDIGSATPAVYEGSPGFVGTAPTSQDAAACVLVNYGINYRERGGKPRSYIPGMAEANQASPNTWNATQLNTFVSVWDQAVAAAASGGASAGVSGCAQCVVLYTYAYTDVPTKHKYLRQRTGVKAIPIVTSRSGNPAIKTQRRRLRAA